MAAFVNLQVSLDNRCFTQVDLHVSDSIEVILELINAAPCMKREERLTLR